MYGEYGGTSVEQNTTPHCGSTAAVGVTVGMC